MDSEGRVTSEAFFECRIESKVMVGQKRGILEVEETFEPKRVKMRDLESVFRSEGHDAPSRIEESNKFRTPLNEEIERNDGLMQRRGFDLDLNAEAISTSIDDPFYPYKDYESLKSRDDSECGSSVGPPDEKDSTRALKGLKQRAVPLQIPKPRGRKKNNNDTMKRKMELAKKEQVDRFARFAAPSGLLNELNPGIINNVRNSKQVYRIIEALVRSDTNDKRHSDSKENDQTKSCVKEVSEKKERENVHIAEVNRISDCTFFSKPIDLNTKDLRADGDTYMEQARSIPRMASECNLENENDGLGLKLSSSITAVVENGYCLSNEESENWTSLSLQGANVASKWLNLLNQDIRGRLAALRRSKKRVGAVISTEFAYLNSREFSSNLDKATVHEHSIKWNTLFGQMHKKLSEEESHLESWLNQVKEMQLYCEQGLNNSNSYHASQQMGSVKNDQRSGVVDDNSGNNLAAMAAAASIFSTCNFLSSI